MSIGTIWNHRDFIEQVYGKEDAVEFEQVVKNYQAEQIGFEQARIIKLLLQHPICVDSDGSTYCDHADCDTDIYWKAHFIELIKGETE